MTDKKQCPHCDTVKPLTEFGKCTRNKDGRYTYCKSCTRLRRQSVQSKARAAKRDRIAPYNVAWAMRALKLTGRDY